MGLTTILQLPLQSLKHSQLSIDPDTCNYKCRRRNVDGFPTTKRKPHIFPQFRSEKLHKILTKVFRARLQQLNTNYEARKTIPSDVLKYYAKNGTHAYVRSATPQVRFLLLPRACTVQKFKTFPCEFLRSLSKAFSWTL